MAVTIPAQLPAMYQLFTCFAWTLALAVSAFVQALGVFGRLESCPFCLRAGAPGQDGDAPGQPWHRVLCCRGRCGRSAAQLQKGGACMLVLQAPCLPTVAQLLVAY